MCLIAYAPKGELLERRVFDYAATQNGDGIGVMSSLGVERFVGRKSRKRAWRAIRKASEAGVPYGIHFRWATHGAVNVANCHPFENEAGDTLVMHNGVLSATKAYATKEKSDTRLFVEYFMAQVPHPKDPIRPCFVRLIEEAMGYDNKFLTYHIPSDTFELMNEDAGLWIDGIWYSNSYSLPADMDPDYGKSYLSHATGAASLTDEERARALCLPFGDSQRAYVRQALTGADEYEDRNVSDAVKRESIVTGGYETDPYYKAIMGQPGYYDDGAELGAHAAMLANGRGSSAMRAHDAELAEAERLLDESLEAYRDIDAEIEVIEGLNDESLSEEDREWVAHYLADMKARRA